MGDALIHVSLFQVEALSFCLDHYALLIERLEVLGCDLPS